MDISILLVLIFFLAGYAVIVCEHWTQVNKAAVAIFVAGACWASYFISHSHQLNENLGKLGHHLSEVSQIIFFLIGAMAIVELIDCHKGFKIITDLIHTTSKRKTLWIIGAIAFFLSSVLDNLTTTILMVSLLRKLVPEKRDRLVLAYTVVIAANAGGAWTPIGDVTTTMLWINGQLSSWAIMKALFIPSLVSLLVPLCLFTFQVKGRHAVPKISAKESSAEPRGRPVFYMGLCALIFVPIFKSLTGLPPFMGILIGLAALWIMTDLIHFRYQERFYLRLPHVLTRIDVSGILFFLGILLCINALETVGILKDIAVWLDREVSSLPMIATLIGIFSAIIDNVPLVAATMGMYSLDVYPMDSQLWHMIAYTAGTGGSMLIIGSAAGVALMGLEKVDFFSYAKKATLPVFLGYFAGLGVYLLFN